MFWRRHPRRDESSAAAEQRVEESARARAESVAGPEAGEGSEPGATASAGTGQDEAFDHALDSLAVILRAAAESVVEIGESDGDEGQVPSPKRALAAWAEHVLLITPAPESLARPGVRDWRGLQRFCKRFFARQRRGVEEVIGGFREVIAAFTARLAENVVADAAGDGQAEEHLRRLEWAARERSPAELKQVALETVDGLGRLIEERQARQQSMTRDLGERIQALRAELVEAQREATTDALTRLSNRVALEGALKSALDYCVLFREPAALLMVDIDHFKQVNDTHGHQAGDAVLRALADRLVMHFPRQADCVARYGGEEFALVLRDCDGETAVRKAEAMREAVRRMSVEHGGRALLITVSVGVAECVLGETAEEWVARADAALYRAKDGGRDQVVEARLGGEESGLGARSDPAEAPA